MKYALLILTCIASFQAYAADDLPIEVTCNKIVASGEADTGLTILLRSNSTAWAKMVTVVENGYVGPRVIANIQVPLQPEVRPGANGYIPEVKLVYKGKGIELTLHALRLGKFVLTGIGSAKLSLPEYTPDTVELDCKASN